MSTKTQITNAINTIDDGGNNTAAEVRTTLNELKDNFYGEVVQDHEGTTNVVTASSVLTYLVSILKQGRKVTLNGSVTNTTGSMIQYAKVFSMSNTEYSPIMFRIRFLGNELLGATTLKMHIDTDGLTVAGAMAAGKTYSFQITYFTQS